MLILQQLVKQQNMIMAITGSIFSVGMLGYIINENTQFELRRLKTVTDAELNRKNEIIRTLEVELGRKL